MSIDEVQILINILVRNHTVFIALTVVIGQMRYEISLGFASSVRNRASDLNVTPSRQIAYMMLVLQLWQLFLKGYGVTISQQTERSTWSCRH